MKVLIADDEPLARERLAALLAELDGVECVGAAVDGHEAVEMVGRLRPDVVLLDIAMPGLDGLGAARAIGALEAPPAIVFCTAYDQHAVEAFEHGAVDYLLKPIRPERLAETLRRVEAALAAGAAASGPASASGLDALVAALQPARRLQWISASLGDTLKLIAVDEVLAFRAEDKMSRLVTADGDAVIRPSLKELLCTGPQATGITRSGDVWCMWRKLLQSRR